MDYKKIISEILSKHVELSYDEINALIEIPPRSEMGDFAFPCFKLSKVMRKAPNLIALELKEIFQLEYFEKIEAFGPYLNFFTNKPLFVRSTIEKILNEGENYVGSNKGEGKNIIVEYSSPNIAKPFHIGHLCTTVIGSSLYKIFNFQGYNGIGINHLGDWGTQFGKLISAYKRWGSEEALEKDPITELLRIYVKFHVEADKNPELEAEGRKYFKALEDSDTEAVSLWSRFRELSLKEFDKLYNTLNIKFDSYAGESFYMDKMDEVIKELDEKGLLVESNGAKVVMLEEHNMPPCIIKKSDGATIYATRDLAAAMYRKKTYDFSKNIYVVGKDQTLHFKQVFTTLKLLGHQWAEDCNHVEFGLVRFTDRKFSTRKGDLILLDELLNEAVAKTLETINKKNPSLENKDEVSRKVGIGAIIFSFLKNHRERDIVFDWNEMLSFEGETGPYVQYTYARGISLLRKIGNIGAIPDYSKLNTKEEFELVKELEGFENSINAAIDKLQPCMITRYIIDVAKAFNKFYNAHNLISGEDLTIKSARVNLVKATLQVIQNGLNLIGVEVVNRM
jgi:arginyl-tRNA synthetase